MSASACPPAAIHDPSDSGQISLDMLEISKKFGHQVALDSVSLSVKPGTVHALLGENGAGKTTLMRIAFGLIKPDSGAIRIRGHEAKFTSPADAIKRRIGMVHQHHALVPSMSVAENIALGGRGRYRSDRTAELVRAVGDRTGLRLEPDRIVSTLTSADRQKLEIIRAFAHDVSILILDEPATILSEADARDLFVQLRVFAGNGGSVVLITHKLRDAMKHADEVTVLRRGQRVLNASVSQLTEASVTAAMLGRPVARAVTPGRDRPATTLEPTIVLKDAVISSTGGVDSLSAINLEIRGGEIVGIAALDGAARSLLRTIAGRTMVVSGSVSIPTAVGFVPENRQEDAILPDASLFDNIALKNSGQRNGLLDWHHIRQLTMNVVHQFDVRTDDPGQPVSTLSGGNQQRFVLGRELQGNPAAIVLENPTQGLDVQAAADIHHRLRTASDSGCTVVFYSSDLDEIAELSHRVFVVNNRKLLSVEPERYAIGRALLGVEGVNSSDRAANNGDPRYRSADQHQ
ncbi:MAG: ATP-binding cassette domain-containing protein [Gemmatimonadaceae bacterium]